MVVRASSIARDTKMKLSVRAPTVTWLAAILYPARTPKGRPIPRRGIARTFAEVLALVARRDNLFPAGASFPAHYGHPAVVFVPLHGWPAATRTLLWRAHGNTALVTAFIDTATAERPLDLPRLGNPGYGDWPGPRAVDPRSPATTSVK
jgi:hypothetical protein